MYHIKENTFIRYTDRAVQVSSDILIHEIPESDTVKKFNKNTKSNYLPLLDKPSTESETIKKCTVYKNKYYLPQIDNRPSTESEMLCPCNPISDRSKKFDDLNKYLNQVGNRLSTDSEICPCFQTSEDFCNSGRVNSNRKVNLKDGHLRIHIPNDICI